MHFPWSYEVICTREGCRDVIYVDDRELAARWQRGYVCPGCRGRPAMLTTFSTAPAAENESPTQPEGETDE